MPRCQVCGKIQRSVEFWSYFGEILEFWGYCMSKISREKPETMQEVCEIVERICRDTPEDMIRRSVDISARVQLCMANNGGHFQNSL